VPEPHGLLMLAAAVLVLGKVASAAVVD